MTGYAQVVEELRQFNGSLTVERTYLYALDLLAQHQLHPPGALEAWLNGTSPTEPVWQTSYYLYDGLGTVRGLADDDGFVTDGYWYDAYGVLLNVVGTTPNVYLYTGEQWDADLGMYFLRARYMEPGSGRFWTMDVYEGFGADPVTLHKYLYANANSVMYSDPSGYFSLGQIAIGMTVGAVIYTATDMLARDVLIKGFRAVGLDPDTPTSISSFGFYFRYREEQALGLWIALGHDVSDFQGNLLAQAAIELGAMAVAEFTTGTVLGRFFNAFHKSPLPCRSMGNCFVAGTLVLATSGEVTIESIEVGDRVITSAAGEPQDTETAVDPASWVLINLIAEDDSGRPIEVTMLRSRAWLEGSIIDAREPNLWLEIPEIGIGGIAQVTNIEPCPEISDGPGRVVLATFRRTSDLIVEIGLSSGTTITTTKGHPFWSDDRDAWTYASDLEIGETLGTHDGKVTVASVSALLAPEVVYNFEVEGEHQYFVGSDQVLVHNASGLRDDYANLGITTSSTSAAPSRNYTIYKANGELFKFGVTDANLDRYKQSLNLAGSGSYGSYSEVKPKWLAHLGEKYSRSLHYSSTGQWDLDGMRYPHPVDLNTGKSVPRPCP